MVAKIDTVAFEGLQIRRVDVQVMLMSGLPTFTIVGLPDKAVAESRERVRAALASLGLVLPAKRITVNLSPADLQKEGSHYDLPIALGLLCAMDIIGADKVSDYIALGELSLDGSILPVNGILPSALYALESKKAIICPKNCGHEAAWAFQGEFRGEDEPNFRKSSIVAATSLLELITFLKGEGEVPSVPILRVEAGHKFADFRDVKGQEQAKRALEIAAAGGHHLLMSGPPGSGKSMLAQRLAGILPPLSPREALDVAIIHSLSGLIIQGGITQKRPFRAPHHTASIAALAGGGSRARPGEISLAHNGVLFMDEFPEFSRAGLEALRQPIETGEVVIARVHSHLTYPSRFQLVAAMNPCRCGYLGDGMRECKQAPECGFKYQSKISGPIFDRIDIHIEVPEISAMDLSLPQAAESSEIIAKRVMKTRNIQHDRFQKYNVKLSCNAHAEGELLEQIAPLQTKTRDFLTNTANQINLSARGYYRVLKVARTISDMENCAEIELVHLAEALQLRRITHRGR